MGPKTMNATSEPGVKLAPSEAAMKASAEEHTEIKKAKTIIIIIDKTGSCPTADKSE